MSPRFLAVLVILAGFLAVVRPASAQATRETEAYRRIKVKLDAVEDNGKTRTLNVSADRAADLLTKRARVLEQLRDCVGSA